MDFSKTGFKSTAHKLIAYLKKFMSHLVLYPESDENNPNEISVLHDGEKDYYMFVINLYKDMYKNPEAYSIPYSEYASI